MNLQINVVRMITLENGELEWVNVVHLPVCCFLFSGTLRTLNIVIGSLNTCSSICQKRTYFCVPQSVLMAI